MFDTLQSLSGLIYPQAPIDANLLLILYKGLQGEYVGQMSISSLEIIDTLNVYNVSIGNSLTSPLIWSNAINSLSGSLGFASISSITAAQIQSNSITAKSHTVRTPKSTSAVSMDDYVYSEISDYSTDSIFEKYRYVFLLPVIISGDLAKLSPILFKDMKNNGVRGMAYIITRLHVSQCDDIADLNVVEYSGIVKFNGTNPPEIIAQKLLTNANDQFNDILSLEIDGEENVSLYITTDGARQSNACAWITFDISLMERITP